MNAKPERNRVDPPKRLQSRMKKRRFPCLKSIGCSNPDRSCWSPRPAPGASRGKRHAHVVAFDDGIRAAARGLRHQ
jgi:hypothetical protein